jgi:transcription elongation factor GreA
MKPAKTFLTQDGLEKLVSELDELKQKREYSIAQLEEVSQPDESGEDGLSTQIKEEVEVLNSKIEEIENAIRTAEIITDNNKKSNIVELGSHVKIKLSSDITKEFYIVSHLESDPSQNKISDQSPLGKALMGKKEKEEIEIDAPAGRLTYKIVSIK